MGIPVTMYDLRSTVKSYLDNQGRNAPEFKNNLPGWDWGEGFLRRHPEVKACYGRNISRKRAEVNSDIISSFFCHLKEQLAGVPAENIFNYDETGFHDDPKKAKHLFRRSNKHPEIIRNSTKTCFTVMFACNAMGKLLPP
jgi:hypothetical protein